MSPGEIHQLVCIQNILFIQHSIRRPSIVLYCFIFRRVNSKTHQLVKIKGIEIDFKASGDPRSKLWHVLSRLLIVTTPYHSQLSGTKGADHLENAWNEDVLWVKLAWIFSGIAFVCRLDYIRGDLNPLYTTATRKNPNTCLCKHLYLVLYNLK